MVQRKLSWMGRCKAIKMTAFPRLLYLFQTLPVKIPVWFMRDISREFTDFVWNHKRPWIPYRTLCCPRSHGGLSLPDVRLYYHLATVIAWNRHAGLKQWVDIEASLCPFPLQGLPWCYSRCTPHSIESPHTGGHMDDTQIDLPST